MNGGQGGTTDSQGKPANASKGGPSNVPGSGMANTPGPLAQALETQGTGKVGQA